MDRSLASLLWAVLTGIATVLVWEALRRTRMNDYSRALPPVVAVLTSLIAFTSLRMALS